MLDLPIPHSLVLLTSKGPGRHLPVDLLAPHELLVEVDHLRQVVIGLQDLR